VIRFPCTVKFGYEPIEAIDRVKTMREKSIPLPVRKNIGIPEGSKRGPSWASTQAVRRVMQGNRSRDTKPEVAVRRAVHALGLRFRVCSKPLPWTRRTADIVFRNARVAVFVDGCFWHGCPEHHVHPKVNAEYWKTKITRNKTRDEETNLELRKAGWTVLRFWSHVTPEHAAAQILAAVRPNRTVSAEVSGRPNSRARNGV
jgi:DNA mismatch endonuclease (patch repair protein)